MAPLLQEQDPKRKKRTLDEILADLESKDVPTLPDPRAKKEPRSLDDILKSVGDTLPPPLPTAPQSSDTPTRTAHKEAGPIREVSDEGEFSNAFRRSIVQVAPSLGKTMQSLGGAGGGENFLTRQGKRLEEWSEDELSNIPAPKVPSMKDVKGAGQLKDYLLGQAGAGVGSLAGVVAGGAAGAAVGGPVGAVAGAAATGYVLAAGSLRDEMKSIGVTDPQLQAQVAIVLGVPVAALDRIVPGKLTSKLVGEAVERVTGRAMVRQGVRTVATETGTEGTQEVLTYGARVPAGKPVSAGEAALRAGDAAVGGMFGGIAGGATEAASDALNNRRLSAGAAPVAIAPPEPPPPMATPIPPMPPAPPPAPTPAEAIEAIEAEEEAAALAPPVPEAEPVSEPLPFTPSEGVDEVEQLRSEIESGVSWDGIELERPEIEDRMERLRQATTAPVTGWQAPPSTRTFEERIAGPRRTPEVPHPPERKPVTPQIPTPEGGHVLPSFVTDQYRKTESDDDMAKRNQRSAGIKPEVAEFLPGERVWVDGESAVVDIPLPGSDKVRVMFDTDDPNTPSEVDPATVSRPETVFAEDKAADGRWKPEPVEPVRRLKKAEKKQLQRSYDEVEDYFLALAELERTIPPEERGQNTKFLQASSVYRYGVLLPFDDFEGKGRGEEIHRQLEKRHGVTVSTDSPWGKATQVSLEAGKKPVTGNWEKQVRQAVESDIPKLPTYQDIPKEQDAVPPVPQGDPHAVKGQPGYVSTVDAINFAKGFLGEKILREEAEVFAKRYGGRMEAGLEEAARGAVLFAQQGGKSPLAPDTEPETAKVGSTVQDGSGKRWIVSAIRENGSASLRPETYTGVPIGRSVTGSELASMKVLSGGETAVSSKEGGDDVLRQAPPGQPEGEPPGGIQPADTGRAGVVGPERSGISGARRVGNLPSTPPQESGTQGRVEPSAALDEPRSDGEGTGPAERDSAGRGDGDGDVERETGVSGRPERERTDPIAAHAPAAVDYKITDADEIGAGGLVGKAKANIAAIRILKQIEKDGRTATVDEQKALVKYTGWGALPGVVSKEPGANWKALNAELKELLDEKELDAARRSTLNAHYTSPVVIRAMWDFAKRMGFGARGERYLEPAMGVGHFLGFRPDDLLGSWTGVELDSLTGRIAKQLYQASDIKVEGFQTAKIAESSIDLAISNVPFGNFPVTDKRYPKSVTASIHNYFFARTLDLLRPGGVMLYVTSRFTMDSQAAPMRKYMADRAHFLGAIRLPDTAFKANAGTEVVTDVMVFQRHRNPNEQLTALDRQFLESVPQTVEDTPVYVNSYYQKNPDQVIGTLSLSGTQYGPDQPTWKYGGDLGKALAKAGAVFTAIDLPARPKAMKEEPMSEGAITAPADMRDGQLREVDGKLMQKVGERLVAADVPQGAVEKVKKLAKLRDAYREALALQMTEASDTAVEVSLKAMNRQYDAFVKQYGPINKEERSIRTDKKTGREVVTLRHVNLREFKEDPEWPLVAALEEFDPETGKATKAAALEGRIFKKKEPISTEADPARALLISLDETGRVSLPRIAELTALSEEDVKVKLTGLAYEDPITGEYQHRSKYLSGNVREKLKQAQEAGFEANVAALEAVQPKDLLPSQISAGLGSAWIPTTDYENFLRDVFQARRARVTRLGSEATWAVEVDSYTPYSTIATNKYGTKAVNGVELLELALNQKSPQVTIPDGDGKRVVDPVATVAAQAKQQELKDEFKRWVWSDDKRAERLARYYNDHFNNMVEPKHDGEHLTFPGMATHIKGKLFKLMTHQKNAIQRALQEGNTLLAHVVGSGKTYTMAAIAVESKRLGFARKPMQIVPNHMLSQATREFQQLYPGAKILVATKEDFSKEQRRAFVARAASGDWDVIIMTHRSFEAVQMSIEFQEDFIRDQLYQLEDSIREAKADKNRDLTKLVEKAMLKLEDKLTALRALDKKDDLLSFEEMGVDLLLVDEADMYKNLQFVSKMRNISAPASQRAFDLYMKSVYLEKINPGRGLVFATGTPIANSMTEVFTMLRYLQLPLLKKLGLEHFDSWAAQFGESVTTIEMNPTATGYRLKERFSKFKNVADLAGLFRQTWDVLTAKDLDLPTPPVKGGKPELVVIPSNEAIKAYLTNLGKRAEEVRSGRVPPDEDNFLKITTDGRHAAMDMRLVDALAGENHATKATRASEKIYEIWKDTHAMRGAQLVFSDISAPGSDPSRTMGGVKNFNIYEELKRKLIEAGIPEREIAFIHEGDTEARKDRLFADVRSGVKRVLIGSTEKMGAGTNVQDRLVALHDLDAPWRPRDIEQRHGRMVRQGNILWDKGQGPLEYVRILRYVQEGSFDAYMWQTLERKAGFIAQAMKAGPETREMEDVDGRALEYSEIKAITSGNPKIMEKAKVDADVAKLEALARSSVEAAWLAKREIATLPDQIKMRKEGLEGARQDLEVWQANPTAGDKFSIEIDGKRITERPKAAELLRKKLEEALTKLRQSGIGATVPVGHFAGFGVGMVSNWNHGQAAGYIAVIGKINYTSDVNDETSGVALLSRLEHVLPTNLAQEQMDMRENRIVAMEKRLRDLEAEASAVFQRQPELDALKARQAQLNAELSETPKPTNPDEDEMDAGGEDGTDDDLPDGPGSGYKAYGFADPFSAGAYALYSSLKDLNTWRKKRQAAYAEGRNPIAPSAFPDIEKRWNESRGLRPVPYSARLRDAWDAIRKASRHFPEIDARKDPVHALVNEQLLEVEHAKEWAIVVAHDKLLQVVGDLSFAETDLLTRYLALNDIQKDVEKGLYKGAAELPFGYTQTTLDADAAAVSAAVKASSKVREAINRRSLFARELTTRLVEIEQLPPEVMNDERYYHRQVLEYAQSMEHLTSGLGTQDVRIHKKGFQRRRTGGGDFNTAYQEAEFEWVSQAVRMIHMHESLQKIKQLADIKPALVLQAKTANRQAYHTKWVESLVAQFGYLPQNAVSPLKKFSVRIAFSTNKLYNLLERGILTPGEAAPWQRMLDALEHDRIGYNVRNAGKSAQTRDPFTFDHPQWFPFLSFLVNRGTEGAMPAATIFKAIREREQEQKDMLGRAYKTWEDMIPDGYDTFQPEEGSYFFRGLTVEQRALDAAIMAADVETREAWIKGQEKPYWVVPEGIASTMEEFGNSRESGAIERAWIKTISMWKQFVLLSPGRFFKYNFNNVSGDVDAANLYPGIYTGIDAAAADSWRFLVSRNMTPELKKEMLELVRLRVVNNTLTVAEIPDISDLPGFGKLAKASPPVFMRMVAQYWKGARTLTQVRENVLRLAAYRYFLKEINAGRGDNLFGASNPVYIKAERDPKRRAASLARDLIGDYGGISVGGQFLRERLFPFFSWQEINAKRYIRLFRNIAAEGGGAGRQAAVIGTVAGGVARGTAFRVAKAAVLANLFLLLVALWNQLMYPEEYEAMRADNRSTHLILGRDRDGKIRTVRVEGAFADFIDWLALRDYPSDIRDLVTGGAAWTDKFLEAVQAPINKVAQMWEPVSKISAELATGRKLYPDAFHPRPIRDKGEYVASQAMVAWAYRKVMDIPQKPKTLGDWATGSLIYATDPGEAAYYLILDRVATWNEKNGNERGGAPEPTKRASTLYYWKKAAQWGNEAQADRWLQRYYDLGGKPEGARRSAEGGDPLKYIPKDERKAFRESLDAREEAALELATRWRTESRVGLAKESLKRVPRPSRTGN